MKRLQVLFAAFLIVALAGGVAFAQSGYDLFQKALAKERAEGKLEEAIQLYKQVVREHASDRTLAAKALVQMGRCYEKLGNVEAQKAYERVVRDYADQPEAAEARARLAALRPAASSSAGAVVMRQVWEKGDTAGMVSPDGRYLSFTDWSTGNLALRDLASGTNRPLTSKTSWSESGEFTEGSIFSHDGKQVAYSWFNGKTLGFDLRVIELDGLKSRVIHAGSAAEFVRPVGWLPDGKSIAAVISDLKPERKGKFEINLVSEADGAVRALKSIDQPASYPALSPDGRYIAYAISAKKEDGRQGDIFLLATDGSGEVPLVVHPADDSVFSWAPDGLSLLFISDRSGTQDLWNIAVADGKPRGEPKRIKQDFGRKATALGFTANNAIFYALVTGSTDIYVAKLGPDGTKLVASPEAVTQRFVGGNLAPEWSPDGRSLAYITQRGVGPRYVGSDLTVTIKTLDTGKERELHPGLLQANSLRWAPDGKSLLVWGRVEGPQNSSWQAYRIDVNTGVADPIVLTKTDATAFAQFFRWSSDGEAMYFVGGPMTGRIIVRQDMRTGQQTEIFRAPKETPFLGSIEPSPDGKWLAFGMDPVSPQPTHVMMVLPIAGGTPRELLRLVAPQEAARLNGWNADSRSILITKVDFGAKKPNEILRIPLEGGSPQLMDLQLPVLGAVRMHPDGQRVVFSSGEYKTDVWVMENLLPAKAPVSTGMVTRRIWDGPQVGIELSISPDERYVSFVDWGDGDLAVRDLTTGEIRRLTHKGTQEESSEFAMSSVISPDSKQVAYAWFNKDSLFDLRVVAMDGTQPRVLYRKDDSKGVKPYDWSPDGKQILTRLGKKDHTNQIACISVADGTVRVLKTFDARYPNKASFSPDGRYIVYDFPPKADSPERDIFLLAADGSREIPLVQHPANDQGPMWAPDGKRVLFFSDRSGTLAAWTIQVANGSPLGAPVLVKPDLGNALPMAITRKGALWYGLRTSQSDIYVAALDPVTGKLLEPPTPAIQHSVGSQAWPDWSPDGRFLSYTLEQSPANVSLRSLNIRSLETGKDRVLLPKLQMFLWPRWAGDSLSLLVFGTDFKGGRGMYRVDALTGETTPLLPPDSKFGAMHAFVSRDGKRLFYLRAGQGTNTAIVRDLATGQEKELYQDAKLNTLELSPDGSQLVVLSYDAKDRASLLILVPAEGGEARELLRTQYPQGIPGFETPGFSADGRFVVFFKQNSGTPPAGPPPAKEMWRIPVTGGELQKLDVGMQTHNVRFHPDGRRIAFTYGQYANEVWVMENFLPAPKASK